MALSWSSTGASTAPPNAAADAEIAIAIATIRLIAGNPGIFRKWSSRRIRLPLTHTLFIFRHRTGVVQRLRGLSGNFAAGSAAGNVKFSNLARAEPDCQLLDGSLPELHVHVAARAARLLVR